MGHEYKLKVELSEKQKVAIMAKLECLSFYYKQYYHLNKRTYEFRNSKNKGELPNFTMVFEDDGIFLCRYDSPKIWKDLEQIENFIRAEMLSVKIIDISG